MYKLWRYKPQVLGIKLDIPLTFFLPAWSFTHLRKGGARRSLGERKRGGGP